MFTIAFPVLVLVCLEVLLRLINYGSDLSLFITEEIGGRRYFIMNPEVKNRYFARVEFSPNTSPDYFTMPKPEETYRIFCLGGSTTVGFPYGYVGSFSSFLRDRLKAMFPERSIEVINLGITATNSYTVVDLARELVEYEPDLFIVYDGHNEFYGALGIASNETASASRWLNRLYLRLVHVRIFVMLRDLYGAVFGASSSTTQEGTMMERLARGQYITYGSETYRQCLENFKANLMEFADICRAKNIPAILGSQVSNLRDQPPFVSEELSQSAEFDRGASLFQRGEFDSALASFQSAAIVDSFHADTHYQLARCLDTLNRRSEALASYIKARDYDRLRFRASSDFNNAIREIADGTLIFFADIERKFRGNAEGGLIGSNLILEHLHPNLRGYLLIAKEYAFVMQRENMLAPPHEWNERAGISDSMLWEQKPVTALDVLSAQRRVEILTSGWPFRKETESVTSASLPHATDPESFESIVEQFVHGTLTWEQAHVAAAEFYQQHGRYEDAEREYIAIINQLPVNVSAYLVLGQLYLRQKKLEQALTVLLTSLGVERTVYALRTLGTIALERGMMHEAVQFLEEAYGLSIHADEVAEVGFTLAVAYQRTGKRDMAIMQLERVLQRKPDFAPARDLLQRIRG